MRHAIVALLVMTSAAATVALAQDGGGHGPPRVVVTLPSLPTIPVPTPGGSLSKLFQPDAELESMMK